MSNVEMSNAESASTEITGSAQLGHLVLYVSDLARSAEFYREVLGWTQIFGGDGSVPVVAFSSGRTHHELLLIEVGPDAAPIPRGRRIGMYHFGVKVGDSDDELRAAQARVESRPDLARVVGASDHTVTHSLYLTDPDGNEIELYIDVPGVDWRNNPALIASPVKPLNL